MVVGTPGRLAQHSRAGILRTRRTHFLALDEVSWRGGFAAAVVVEVALMVVVVVLVAVVVMVVAVVVMVVLVVLVVVTAVVVSVAVMMALVDEARATNLPLASFVGVATSLLVTFGTAWHWLQYSSAQSFRAPRVAAVALLVAPAVRAAFTLVV